MVGKAPKPTSTHHGSRNQPYPTTHSNPLKTTPKMASYQPRTPPPSRDDPNSERHHPTASWLPEADEMLRQARAQGLNWGPIAAKYFPDKTANACRKRHERLMEKQNVNDSFGEARMETLAKEYLEVREQMWGVLADRLGEKWQLVESKCMEKGLKTLTTTGRRASHRPERARASDDLSTSLSHSRRSRSPSHDNVSEGSPSPYSRGNHDDHHHAHFSAGGLTNNSPTSNRSYTPIRTFSDSTSSFYMPTPTVTASDRFASPNFPYSTSPIATTSSPWNLQPHDHQPAPPIADPTRKDASTTLPSFGVAFAGMPSVLAGNLARSQSSSSYRLPVTTH